MDRFVPTASWSKTLKGMSALAAVLVTPLAQAATPVPAAPAAASNSFRVPGQGQWHPEVLETKRTPEVASRQEQALQNAGQPFRNTLGHHVKVEMHRLAPNQLEFRLNGNPAIPVDFDAAFTPAEQIGALAHLIDLESQFPRSVQTFVTHYEVHTAGSLGKVQAQTGGSTVRFFGLKNIASQILFHEFGHLTGKQQRLQEDGAQAPLVVNAAPNSWAQSIAQDHDSVVSDYATHTAKAESKPKGLGEDFAEFFASYLAARAQGKAAVRQLSDAFPARTAHMQKIWKNMSSDRSAVH